MAGWPIPGPRTGRWERLECLAKCNAASLCFQFVLGECMQKHDALRLLYPRRERRVNRRAAKERDELALPHVEHRSSSCRFASAPPVNQQVGLEHPHPGAEWLASPWGRSELF